MNWEAIGALGEIAGAGAVVLTLLYLSRQIKEQSRALQTTTRDSVFRQVQDFNLTVIADPRLGGILQRGMATEDWGVLEEDDRARVLHALYSFFKMYENMYLHRLEGSISAEAWESNREILFIYAAQPGARYYLGKRWAAFDPRFRTLIESSESPVLESGVTVSKLPG